MYKETGKIVSIGPVMSRTTSAGSEFQSQVIVLEIPASNGTFKKLALTGNSYRLEDIAALEVGDQVGVTFTVNSREYNGRWYHDVNLFHIDRISAAKRSAEPEPPTYSEQDLPF